MRNDHTIDVASLLAKEEAIDAETREIMEFLDELLREFGIEPSTEEERARNALDGLCDLPRA